MSAFKLFLQNFDGIFFNCFTFFSISTVLLELITLEINKINNDHIFLCICELKNNVLQKEEGNGISKPPNLKNFLEEHSPRPP